MSRSLTLTRSLSLLALACTVLASGLTLAQHSGHDMPMPASSASKGTLPLTVKDARVIAVPPGIKETTVIATLTNTSNKAIVLSGVKTDVAGMGMLMVTVKNGNLIGMKTVPTLTVPAGKTLKMNELGDHIMLMDLKRPLKVGEVISMTLLSKDGRSLTLKATVKKPGS